MTIVQPHRTERSIHGGAGQAEDEPLGAILLCRAQPQIMRVFQHCQRFAAIDLHSKLGAQIVEARMSLQRVQHLFRQCAGVEQHLRVYPGGRTEHQIAYIITLGMARPQSSGEQAVDQRRRFAANPANLQVGAVGRLDHPSGISFGAIRHGDRLPGLDRATAEFDPADTTVQCLDDPQQPGTGRRAQKGGFLMWIHRMTGTR